MIVYALKTDLCSLTALYWDGVSYVVSILSPSFCQIDNGVVEDRWRGGGWMDGGDIRMDG